MKLLFCCFGSTGDLLPFLTVAHQAARSNDVAFVVNPALSLQCRREGFRTYSLGGVADVRALADTALFRSGGDGWRSWRVLFHRYLGPSLNEDVSRMRRVLANESPDRCIIHPFSIAARLAAAEREVPCRLLSVYPQFQLASTQSPRFGGALGDALAQVELPSDLRHATSPVLACLTSPAETLTLLYEPLLLGDASLEQSTVGFPYWDMVVGSPPAEQVLEQFGESPGPRVLVCLGSLISITTRQNWQAPLRALRLRGIEVTILNSTATRAGAELAAAGIRCAPYAPGSYVYGLADVVIHHGGVGTTHGVLRSGVPSVVVPHAFDQGFNARNIERLGTGRSCCADDLEATVLEVLNDPGIARRSRQIQSVLPDTDAAALLAVDRLVR